MSQIMSSAKRPILWDTCPTISPVMWGCERMAWAKGSMTSAKIEGHP